MNGSAQPTLASPADTVSPDTDPSRYNTPVSAATTISPDFAPRNYRRSPLPAAQSLANQSSNIIQETTLPPPPLATNTSNGAHSGSRVHTDRFISPLTPRTRAASAAAPISAIDALHQNTAQAISDSRYTTQEDLAQKPPGARRAASTGIIEAGGQSSRSADRFSTTSGWKPGMPLPPPPPGPPPSAIRSHSLNGQHIFSPPELGTSSLPAPPKSRAAGLRSTLGPVPPTPADWREGELEPNEGVWRNRPNLPLQLHIDTSSVLAMDCRGTADQSSAAPRTPCQFVAPHRRRESSSGALARSPAVRNRSEKGIRERRSESRNGKCREIDSAGGNTTTDTTLRTRMENVRPTNLILPSQSTLSRRRADSRSPEIDKSTRSPDKVLKSPKAKLQATVELSSPSGEVPLRRVESGPLGHPSEDACDGAKSTLLSRTDSACSFGPESTLIEITTALPSSRSKSNSTHPLPSSTRKQSGQRPVSHLLHLPNTEDSAQSRLLPYSPPKEVQIDLLGPESPRAFAQRANERHRKFAEREASAADDAERLSLFVQFMLAESRIRRDQYLSVFEDEDIDIDDLVHGFFGKDQAMDKSKDLQSAPLKTRDEPFPSMQGSSESDSSVQGSIWQAASTMGSGKNESPITTSSISSPHTKPEQNWWKDYVPCLSPIASMSIVTGQDEMDSRGRAPSRWWEDRSGHSASAESFNVLGRSKRESKYMGLPKEARNSPAILDSRTLTVSNDDGFQNKISEHFAQYGANEYPPEKVVWDEGKSPYSRSTTLPSPPRSAPCTFDSRKLDISRLVTLPPPFPRHHPAVNNSHPDLTDERAVVRLLHDLTEASSLRESFETEMNEKRKKAESWCKHQQFLHEQEMQFQMEQGDISPEAFNQAQLEIEQKVTDSRKQVTQLDFDLFQSKVVTPLHALFSERTHIATSSLDKLSGRLFSDAQQRSPNLPQEEGDEQAELLEKLTQLKWLFEARESLHCEIFNLLSERNDKYKAIILLPYRQSENRDKILEAESFFAKDGNDRRLAFEQAVAGRAEAFLAVVESNVSRGVEIQLSAFWDIAPSLMQILHRIPPRLDEFDIQIPPSEYAENPSFHRHPMQYLYC